MEIAFCDRCDASIPQSDVERRVAKRSGGVLLCAVCRRAERAGRLGRLVLAPLALALAALAGAGIAVAILMPRVRELERVLGGVREEVREPAPADNGIEAELAGLRELAESQRDALAATREGIRDEVAGIAGRVVEQIRALAGEVRELKAWAASEPVPVLPEPAAAPDAAAGAGASAVDVEFWLEWTADADPGVRFSALKELAKADDERVRARARELLTDPESTVRAQAARILGDAGEIHAIRDLASLLSDPNIRVRAVAHDAVSKLVGPVAGYDATAPEEVRERAVAAFLETLD